VPDHHQHALDDDGRGHVEALVALGGVERDDAQTAGRASGLDEDAAVNLVGQAVRGVPASEKQEAHFGASPFFSGATYR